MLMFGPYAASCFLLSVLTLAKWVMSQTGFRRMRGLKMYVDNQLCNTISDELYYPPLVDTKPVPIHVQCNTPLTGRYVTLVKNFTGTVERFHYEILSVCDVQVWAISNGSTMTRPKEDSPQNTSTGNPVAVIAGAVGAVVALHIAVFIVVFVVMRKKRHKTPDPGHSTANSAAHQADNKIAVIDEDVTTGGSVSMAEDHRTDNDTASTTDNVYEIIEESGHYYDPLSHRNTYINDNTMYTTPVFTKEEEGGGT